MPRRLLIATLLFHTLFIVGAPSAGAQDCPQPSSTQTFRGELIELEQLFDEEPEDAESSDDTDDTDSEDGEEAPKPPKRFRAVILEMVDADDSDDEDDVDLDEDTNVVANADDGEDDAVAVAVPVRREFLLVGKGDKIDIGSFYVVDVTEFNLGVIYEDRVAYLGEDIECSDGSSILALDDDGQVSEVDISGFDLPSLPIDPRQIVVAFGVLALVTFIFREPRVNQ